MLVCLFLCNSLHVHYVLSITLSEILDLGQTLQKIVSTLGYLKSLPDTDFFVWQLVWKSKCYQDVLISGYVNQDMHYQYEKSVVPTLSSQTPEGCPLFLCNYVVDWLIYSVVLITSLPLVRLPTGVSGHNLILGNQSWCHWPICRKTSVIILLLEQCANGN